MRIPCHRDDTHREDAAMTPMIDIVFLLLVFLLCAASGQIQESLLPADLPAGSIAAPQADPQPRPFGEVWLYLRTAGDGRTTVQVNDGGEIYSDFGLLERQLELLAAATTEIPVILDIDPTVPLGDMIHVYDAARAAKFETINFAIDPPPQPKSSN